MYIVCNVAVSHKVLVYDQMEQIHSFDNFRNCINIWKSSANPNVMPFDVHRLELKEQNINMI